MRLARPVRLVVPGLLAAGWMMIAAGPRVARAGEHVFHREDVMGTSLELVVKAGSFEAAERAEGRVLRAIDRLARVLSGYDPASEFRRWHDQPGAGPVAISSLLFDRLQACDRWRERTRGAFDVRVAGLALVWKGAAARGRLPTERELAPARAAGARPAWRLDPDARTAERLSDAPLTLDAIAKGFIVEQACAAALDRAEGVTGALLNVGGDLRVMGDLVGQIGIAPARGDSESTPPHTLIRVTNRAVATSGDAHRGYSVNGRWYSHVFDPRTGQPAAGVRFATVVGNHSEDADALATALNVLDPIEGLALARSLGEFECLIVGADGREHRSAGWPALELARPAPSLVLATASPGPAQSEAPHWADESEVAVHFELNRPTDIPKGYRRPYVAVWVENADGLSVRTLAMWVSQTGAGPFQWLPDLKKWHAADRARKKVDKQEVIFLVARPTRPPGQYSVVWDGKDDRGKPLPAGEYTICVDAAREHGTYQHVRARVAVGGAPSSQAVPDSSGPEIRSARVEYRRKGTGK